MSIASEIQRISGNVTSALAEVAAKGVTVPSGANSDDLAGLIRLIQTGGGGLEYETGTWTPASDVARGEISFSKTHTSAPVIVVLSDTTGTVYSTNQTNYVFAFVDFTFLFGSGFPYSTTALRDAAAYYSYRSTSTTTGGNYVNIRNEAGSTTSSCDYWVEKDKFHPYSNSDSRYWRANRTYKWIAVWKP